MYLFSSPRRRSIIYWLCLLYAFFNQTKCNMSLESCNALETKCEISCHLFGIGFTGELFFERSMIFSPLPSRYHKTDTTISTSVFMYTWLFRNSKFNFDTTTLNNFSLAVKRKKVETYKIPKHIVKFRYTQGKTCPLLNSVQKFIEIQIWLLLTL